MLPHTASSNDDVAGRLRDAEAAIQMLVAALKAERSQRKRLSESLDELEDIANRHKKRVKRAETELEELRTHVTQLSRGPPIVGVVAGAPSPNGAVATPEGALMASIQCMQDAAVMGAPGMSAIATCPVSSTPASSTKKKRDITTGRYRSANSQQSSGSRREYLSFTTVPDPDRPVTDEDKQRIRSNINRLPPERMPPLVSFVQGQLPTIALALPDDMRVGPNDIEVDFDTLDNRTLRAVDHKVRQALALAGQARRRAERRYLEMQLEQEQQQRFNAVGGMECAVPGAAVTAVVAPANPQ